MLCWPRLACLVQLDGLTGQPRPEDILLFAVPVCAPYQVQGAACTQQHRSPGGLLCTECALGLRNFSPLATPPIHPPTHPAHPPPTSHPPR